jgi:hypothetical protein
VNDEAYSLSNLRDIVVPDPPALWPPAPGVWLMLGILAALVLAVAWYAHASWQRKAYRRAGLALLGDARTAYDVAVILKRVALAAFPRGRVASLYGEDWVAFLNQTCSDSDFAEVGTADAGAPPGPELIQLADRWIRHHRVPGTPRANR